MEFDENKSYRLKDLSASQLPVDEPLTQVSIGKDSIGKDNINNKRFTPPTLDEVKEYCKERNNSVDPESFINFYESKGWVIGKSKMKDWKAAVRTWERNEKKKPSAEQKQYESGYDFDEMERYYGLK